MLSELYLDLLEQKKKNWGAIGVHVAAPAVLGWICPTSNIWVTTMDYSLDETTKCAESATVVPTKCNISISTKMLDANLLDPDAASNCTFSILLIELYERQRGKLVWKKTDTLLLPDSAIDDDERTLLNRLVQQTQCIESKYNQRSAWNDWTQVETKYQNPEKKWHKFLFAAHTSKKIITRLYKFSAHVVAVTH